MKRPFTLFAVLFLTLAGFSQQATIAKWTFPTGNATDTLPDEANALNTTKSIFTAGGVSGIAFKNGATTKAAQATGWQQGKDTKSWQVEINTTGIENIRVSSKHTAGGSYPGPRDLKLQYRIGTGEWTDVPGGSITVGNDWSSGVLNSLALPAECGNQPSVRLRWVMTSNSDINGADVASTGISKVDDIVITGQAVSGIDDRSVSNLKITAYPNPCTDMLHIESETPITGIEIFNITGSKVFRSENTATGMTIRTASYIAGRYFIVARFKGNPTPTIRSFIRQ